MSTKLGLSQLRAWSEFIETHARAFREIEKRMEGTKGVVPFHVYDVLFVLNRNSEKRLRLSELADTIVSSRSALTRSVDKMVEAGLVKKVKCEEDKRGQYAEITEKGRSALKSSWPHYRSAIYENFGKFLTNSEAKALMRILSKLPKA